MGRPDVQFSKESTANRHMSGRPVQGSRYWCLRVLRYGHLILRRGIQKSLCPYASKHNEDSEDFWHKLPIAGCSFLSPCCGVCRQQRAPGGCAPTQFSLKNQYAACGRQTVRGAPLKVKGSEIGAIWELGWMLPHRYHCQSRLLFGFLQTGVKATLYVNCTVARTWRSTVNLQ